MRLFARNTLLAAVICTGGLWASDVPAGSQFTTVWKFRGLASSVNGLVMQDGKAHGVVTYGGPQRLGTVVALSPPASGKGAWTEETLYTFENRKGGYWPAGNVAFDDHGALYGVTGGRCKPVCEAAFQLTPSKAAGGAWTYTVIHEFSEGGVSSLTWHDGSLYGTTSGYAPNAIFQLTPPASGTAPGTAWRFTQVHNFTSHSDPTVGYSVVFDKDGALYGVGSSGGASGYGAVFQLAPPTAADGPWTATVLYDFTGGSDGGYPSASLVLDQDGVLYGTTGYIYGSQGPGSQGTIFRLAPPQIPGGAWTQTTLYTFQGGSDGFDPNSTLVFDSSGALYGTAAGGSGICPESGSEGQDACGTVFRLAPPAAPGDAWTKSEIENFNGGADGLNPSGVVFDPSGALIGSTTYGDGKAFRLIPPASGGPGPWTLHAIYNFARGSDGTVGVSEPGTIPFAIDGQGALYVPASGGGSLPPQSLCPGGCGAVVRLTPPAKPGQSWTHDLLYRFQGGSDGAYPIGLSLDKNGVLYGNTDARPLATPPSYGSIFQLTPPTKAGGTWTHTVIYAFAGPDGASPTGPLVFGDDGSLYGITDSSGGPGLVFQLVPPASPGGAWTENTIYSLECNTDDCEPVTLAFHDGALYGTTYGGTANILPRGNVFKLSPPTAPGGAWTMTVLYAFTGGADGANPDGNLAFDGHGAIYGTVSSGGPTCAAPNRTCGLVYRLTPPATAGGAWTEAVLYQFQGHKDGDEPNTLVFHNGALEGTTFFRGTGCCGTLFQLTPPAGNAKAWTKTVLHDFTVRDGIYPQGLLLSGGKLYGICSQGGLQPYGIGGLGAGTLFEYTF